MEINIDISLDNPLLLSLPLDYPTRNTLLSNLLANPPIDFKVFRFLIGTPTKDSLILRVRNYFKDGYKRDSYGLALLECLGTYESIPWGVWRELYENGVPSDCLPHVNEGDFPKTPSNLF